VKGGLEKMKPKYDQNNHNACELRFLTSQPDKGGSQDGTRTGNRVPKLLHFCHKVRGKAMFLMGFFVVN
jgi:hypothetical protein